MNEDQDFNENLASEDTTKENADLTQNDKNTEGLGEAVIAAAKKGANIEKKKKSKLFSKSDKDDQQDAKIAELTNDLQRTRADFENFRRQSDIQKQHYGIVVKMTTVKKVLPLQLGLTKIASNKGEAFNPDLHDAVMVDGDGDEEVIEETLRAGYYYDGEVLRPAMVKVSKQ